MNRLRTEKLHTRLAAGVGPERPVSPRCYALTHSDRTGDLYLTIGAEYDEAQISGWYTRLMRDEVLAEWQQDEQGPSLHVHCHVSGGMVFGTARWRYAIFRRELQLVLEAFRFGDRMLFEAHPELDQALVWIHFHSTRSRYDRTQLWGTPADYRLLSVGGTED